MSPLFAALPPTDLPTHAYVPPTAVHGAAPFSLDVAMSPSRSHTVRPGDTVYDIAARYDVSVQSIVHANSLSDGGRWILPGDTLRISGGAVAVPAPGHSSPTGGAEQSGSGPAGTVTVRAGDTLSHIAARHGTTVSALATANDLSDTRLIYPGQRLRLSGSSGSATSSSGSTNAGSSSSSQSRSAIPSSLSRPYDERTVGDLLTDEEVASTFLHYQYSSPTARAAAANRIYLSNTAVPGRDEIKQMIVDTSRRHGVDPTLMLALSYQESGWNHQAVSPANAIGAMQVIPMSGDWASSLVGRELNLLDPQDNVTAGVVVMRALMRSADSTDDAIGGYYQGLASVRQHGLFTDTRQYVANIKAFMRTL